ncbi:MAG: hypothetical protein IPL46_13975 [Saprospiraceae bacterium]|nr:hypothetical protein [Saprospiraceae bacterium]
MNRILNLLIITSTLFLFSDLQAQENPSKWRFVANIQDAYRVGYLLPFGLESTYPHHTD